MAREGEVSHLFMLGVGGKSALINCQLMQIMYLYINITLQTSPLTLTLPNRLCSVDMSVFRGPIRSAFPMQHEKRATVVTVHRDRCVFVCGSLARRLAVRCSLLLTSSLKGSLN